MKPENINSKLEVKEEDIIFAVNRTGILSSIYFEIPVYFVDPSLMDQIYPPEKRKFIDPRCVKNILSKHCEKDPEPLLHKADEMWERIENCREPSPFVVMGVYFSNTRRIRDIVRDATGFNVPPGRGIFICPERIHGVAEDYGDFYPSAFRLLFAAVLIHELAHAYMDEGKWSDEAWERVIEESLANAFVLKCLWEELRDEMNKYILTEFLSTQPIEYRGYRFFVSEQQVAGVGLEALGKSWGDRTITSYASMAMHRIRVPSLRMVSPLTRRRLTRYLWEALPSPWDEVVRDIVSGKRPRQEMPSDMEIEIWKNMAAAILRLLV